MCDERVDAYFDCSFDHGSGVCVSLLQLFGPEIGALYFNYEYLSEINIPQYLKYNHRIPR